MKIQEVMTTGVAACSPQTDLAAAAGLMWEHDCGILPVVEDGRVLGVITDRDICIAAATKPRDLAHISAGEAITGEVFACSPEADVREALDVMRRQRVRRLPVIDDEGQLRGLISLNDVVLRAEEKAGGKAPGVSYADVVNTFKEICAHPPRPRGEEQSGKRQAAGA